MTGHRLADGTAQLPHSLHGPGKVVHVLRLSLDTSVVHPTCEWLDQGPVSEVEGMDPAAVKSLS